MRENKNQLAYAVNDSVRKNSEIPTNVIGRHQNTVYKNSFSDDEDLEYHNPNSNQQNPLQLAAQHNWRIDSSRITNSMFDPRHIASRQIAQQLSRPIPYSTILLTILAVFISGFKGTAFLIIDLRDPEDETQNGGFILRAFWRQVMITLFFLPLVYQEYSKEKREEIEDMRLYQKERIFNKKCLQTIVLCAFAYAVWVGTMAYSVFHTSMANVYIFNNIYPLFLVISKFLPSSWFSKEEQVENQPSNNLEKIGALLAVIVLTLLVYEDTSVIHAELIALVGALSASIYYSNLQKIVFEYPWMLAVLLLSGFTAFFFGVYSMIFENSTLDMNTNHGLFGVFSFEWIFIHIVISLLTGVVNTKLFSYISQQLKTMYVDIAIMSEAFAAMILAFLFGFQELPNLTQCAIYFFYIVALVMLAVGKSEAQIEQISLQDENNLRVNPIVNGFSIPNSAHRNIGLVSNNRGSYLPPSVFATGGGVGNSASNFATPNNKQQALQMPIYKKNTIGQVNDMAMTDFAKMNLLNQRPTLNENTAEAIKNINYTPSQFKQFGSLQDTDHKSHQDPSNYHSLQNAPINVIMEQDEDINESRYIGKSNQQNDNHNYDSNGKPHTLNDSIADFNRQFLKNLKNKDYN